MKWFNIVSIMVLNCGCGWLRCES